MVSSSIGTTTSIRAWMERHWKFVLTTAASAVALGFGYVHELDARFDDQATAIEAVRMDSKIARDSITYNLSIMQKDVGQIRCMIVRSAQSQDPLGCIE